MNKKRTSILTDLEKNYKDTKSISKSVDLSALENDINPHQIYNKLMKNVDDMPKDTTSNEKISVGDIVSLNQKDDNNQYEIINISNKDYVVLKNISTDEVIEKTYNEIKPVMENIDMAKKKLNETQYTVSISDLTTTDANALSQMMSAAAQADSGSSDVSGLDMTSTPELPVPGMGEEPVIEPGLDEPVLDDDMGMSDISSDEPSFEDSDLEGLDDDLPSEVENPLNSPEMDPEMDYKMGEDSIDDIEFDEEIEPTEDELEMDIEEPIDDSEIIESEEPLEEAYNGTYETIKRDYLNGDMSDEEAISALLDCGEAANEEEAIDILNGLDDEGWSEDGSNDYINYDRPNWIKDDELEEDILLPSETKDETFNAKKKLEDDKDEESEKISESMDALIKSILENSGTKTEQEVYAEEITEDTDNEDDEEITLEDAKDNLAYWKHRLRIVDMGDDYSYSNGSHDRVERKVDYWRKKVEELSMNNKEITEEDELDESFGSESDLGLSFSFMCDNPEQIKELFGGQGEIEKDVSVRNGNGYEYTSKLMKATPENIQMICKAFEAMKTSGCDSYSCSLHIYKDGKEERIFNYLDKLPEVKLALTGSKFNNKMLGESEEYYEKRLDKAVDMVIDFLEDQKYYYSDDEDWKGQDYDYIKATCNEVAKSYNVNPNDLFYDVRHKMNINPYGNNLDSEITEALKNAGVTIEEATVKPTIVTDESTFANKPNKALKPKDDKEPKVKKVSTSEFGAEATEPFHCPSMKCEAVAPKEKIKHIFETAKIRYSKADKADWNKLDRRYITKLIENGCGYQRASRIILEAKKR